MMQGRGPFHPTVGLLLGGAVPHVDSTSDVGRSHAIVTRDLDKSSNPTEELLDSLRFNFCSIDSITTDRLSYGTDIAHCG